MYRVIAAVFFSMLVSIYAINRPVYKIVLTQKGYAQFLQYDVVTPPIAEFTFCTWIRVYDLAEDQSIFTYVANGNNRVIRLWLDSGGRYMKVSIDGKVTTNVLVKVVKDVWRHVCLSYQSDYGAWSLYVDSRLVSCEAAASLHGFVLPEGGSVIIGYGTADNGASNGFEGEIFGANMILSSTIERNFTMKTDPIYEQKRFPRNKLRNDSKYTNYVVLSDLLNDEIHNSFENHVPHGISTNSYNNFRASFGFEEHNASEEATTKIPQTKPTAAVQEDFDFTISDFRTTNKDKLDFWNTNGSPRFTFAEVYKSQATNPTSVKLLHSDSRAVPTVSEYETPPPPPHSQNFYFQTEDAEERTAQSIYNLSKPITGSERKNQYSQPVTELLDIETPPPEDKNTKVFGQWTSSRFAGNVLNYLKSINFKNRDHLTKRVPQTIPLYKTSDSYPYSSEFKLNIIRPPSQFKPRKVVEKRFDVIRRDPQINVHILEDDLRNSIIKMHAETQPKKVEIKSRGESKKRSEHRFYRNTQYEKEEKNSVEEYQPKPFILKEERENNHRYFVQPTPSKPRTTKLPFLKSFKYLLESETENLQNQADKNNPDTYTKNLTQRNMWHNAKSYSNDYTPRKINIDYPDELEYHGKLYPSLRLNYAPQKPKQRDSEDEFDQSILNARKLATDVSNQSFAPHDSVSILTYNYGNMPPHNELSKKKFNNDVDFRKRYPSKRNMKATNFDQHVKIGNALNERIVIGVDEEQKQRSFVGGNENIPDINKYRSDLDNENTKVPPSLGPRECKNVELYDRVLYVQPDESIDLTHILSPVREKNIAIEFVMQNYKKCSLTDSPFQMNALLLIDWSKTPVRLFGGAYPRTTTDLCGFF